MTVRYEPTLNRVIFDQVFPSVSHMVFLEFPANLAQLVVPKMHCLYANATMQQSMQYCPYQGRIHVWSESAPAPPPF